MSEKTSRNHLRVVAMINAAREVSYDLAGGKEAATHSFGWMQAQLPTDGPTYRARRAGPTSEFPSNSFVVQNELTVLHRINGE